MKNLVKKVESIENGAKIKKYYFLGKIPYLTKIRGAGFRKTFILNYCISKHQNKIFQNTLNYQNLLSQNYSLSDYNKTIDIIIPVYNGFDYLQNLFTSLKENTDLPYRLIVINDNSSDARVAAFLEKQKKFFNSSFILLTNKQNLGFVKSVNKAFEHAENDVVIINTDVVLPKNWASKLLFPLLINNNAASVTPFSNAATIFSLPLININNNFEADLEKVNTALAKINPSYKNFEFPTGIGFCMAIRKTVLDKIGNFDEIFEKGYGEETDWCQRAINAGFINTIAPNLFVWHKHGGSFDSDEKKLLLMKHSEIISARYPDYLNNQKNC